MFTGNMRFVVELKKQMDEQKNHLIEQIQYGKLETIQEYKRLCGVLEGIRFVEEVAVPEAEKICNAR